MIIYCCLCVDLYYYNTQPHQRLRGSSLMIREILVKNKEFNKVFPLRFRLQYYTNKFELHSVIRSAKRCVFIYNFNSVSPGTHHLYIKVVFYFILFYYLKKFETCSENSTSLSNETNRFSL